MRYKTLVESLTAEQRREITTHGVDKSRISDWKAGRRHPNAAQMKVLALVTGEDVGTLLNELAELEASAEQLSFFRRAVERASAVMTVAGVAVLVGFVSSPSPAEASQLTPSPVKATDRLYIMSNLRRWLRRTLTALTRSTGRPALTMASR